MLISSRDPGFSGKEEVTSKWKDSEGNIWYKIQGSYSNGTSTVRFQGLHKLSKSASVCEFVTITVPKYDPNTYPTKIDPQDKDYRIYYRAEK